MTGYEYTMYLLGHFAMGYFSMSILLFAAGVRR